MLTFQQLIHKLSTFWEKQGCVVQQGHDLETGAGTFNPATFLRCLGPEPYRSAYVEPSRRPADGRYGENPNRLQLFHQFQVIFKPSPDDIQKRYLKSLDAIGIDLRKHDIRFVQDDWESPTIGAHGLGWEVWMDGMEVTQWTYFQAIANMSLKPISVEITYGLERLCMYVQNKDNVFDIQWNEIYTYGDICKRNEIEWSAYNFVEASTTMWLSHFEDYEREAKQLIARSLPIPAYDFVIKASHAFNILEARGVISVTERTGYIARIRDLARLIAAEYLQSREKQGFPLLKKFPSSVKTKPSFKKLPKHFKPHVTKTFLLEIGSEQLPATFIPIGMQNLENAFRALLEKSELTFEKIHAFGAPRRLGVIVYNLSEGTSEKILEKKGPSITIAFDAQGSLTSQGKGFFHSLGISECNLQEIRSNKHPHLQIRLINGQEYLFAKIKKVGRSVYEILLEHLPSLILHLDFPKKMYWDSQEIAYPRPIRWILSLFGTRVIPFTLGEIVSGRHTFGHAQLDPRKILLKKADEYFSLLKKHKVLADVAERKTRILEQLSHLENELKVQALEQKKVLAQVLHLTEWPTLTSNTFDAKFLKIPPEVLISEMVEHQRYFPVEDIKGNLKNLFLITADTTPNDLIRHGNQKVLSARLSDGMFLYEEDVKIPLENFIQKLEKMTFQKDLGSMQQKVLRIAHHISTLHEFIPIGEGQKLSRAALLCKADLATQMVKEFPELQGIIGKYYALAQKEDPEVATAIEEHWLPKIEGGSLPKTQTGILLSIADKIDNLLGYFSVGLIPTSSSDPYALRRQTIGMIKIFIQYRVSLDLEDVFNKCMQAFSSPIPISIIEEILAFITTRAKSVFIDLGFAKDEVESSLAGLCRNPYDQYCKIEALHLFRKQKHFEQLFEVYKRAKGQLEKKAETLFDPALAKEPAENQLMHALDLLERIWKNLLLQKQYTQAFEEMAKLQPHLAHLFDTVKILSDDPLLQNNRIALLQRVFARFEDLVDFSKIQEK